MDAKNTDQSAFQYYTFDDETGQPPDRLLILAVEQTAFFPGMGMPIRAGNDQQTDLLEMAAKEDDGYFGFIARRAEGPTVPGNMYTFGVAAKIERTGKLPSGTVHYFVRVVRRFKVLHWEQSEMPSVRVEYPEETNNDPVRTRALLEKAKETFRELLKLMPGQFKVPDFLDWSLNDEIVASRLADFVAGNLGVKQAERQQVIEEFELSARLEMMLVFLTEELEMRKLGEQIQNEIRSQVEKRQREGYLREQLGAIKRELGEEKDDKVLQDERFEEKIREAGMPEDVEQKARKELDRLRMLAPESPEHNVIRTYLDVLLDLPWSRRSEDNVHIKHARKVLNDDHYGLHKVKDRITEFLAVQKLTRESGIRRSPILCLSGPPGVGKTSLGKSIARATGREFYRFSLGGMRDEAEIKGHRRTYVGAMPGKIIQAMARAGTSNPVIVLDEIDKLGHDWRGDPSSAMLEVLDPAQNGAFLDHYLDVPFDLSDVFFICTANVKESIPRPLLDRMEVVDISGYMDIEKVEIAKRHLVPRQREEHGLKPAQLSISEAALMRMIREHTLEAGVRNLERTIAAACRKTASAVAGGDAKGKRVTARNLDKLLGAPRFKPDRGKRIEKPGVAIGLAWTPFGGDTLVIESTVMSGRGQVSLTGQLGDVMNESAHIALSYLRANAIDLGLNLDLLKKHDVHIHFPAGAIPKDGPSAGVTITAALLSLFSGRCFKSHVAMTGEITLTGKVLPVGGVREKVLSAHRTGIKKVILPRENMQDLEEVPPEILDEMLFVPVDYFDQIVSHALTDAECSQKTARLEPVAAVPAVAFGR